MLHRKSLCMLTDLKMACKWAFYRPEHNAERGPQGTEF